MGRGDLTNFSMAATEQLSEAFGNERLPWLESRVRVNHQPKRFRQAAQIDLELVPKAVHYERLAEILQPDRG